MKLKGEKVAVAVGRVYWRPPGEVSSGQGVDVVRAVDVKPLTEWYQTSSDVENLVLDLKDKDSCYQAAKGVKGIFQLARIWAGWALLRTTKPCACERPDQHAHAHGRARFRRRAFLYSSSACVYNGDSRKTRRRAFERGGRVSGICRRTAMDGRSSSASGCAAISKRISDGVSRGRYHNVYGPLGTWDGGREKAPAAICRKVIQAKASGKLEIEIWGDGKQTRSFMYIDDCTKGTLAITESDIDEPINLGSSELVTINQLVDIVEEIAGVKLKRHYKLDAPKGVNGRNSDNTMILERLGWEPSIRLKDGMART